MVSFLQYTNMWWSIEWNRFICVEWRHRRNKYRSVMQINVVRCKSYRNFPHLSNVGCFNEKRCYTTFFFFPFLRFLKVQAHKEFILFVLCCSHDFRWKNKIIRVRMWSNRYLIKLGVHEPQQQLNILVDRENVSVDHWL